MLCLICLCVHLFSSSNHRGKKMSDGTHTISEFCPIILTCHFFCECSEEHLLRDKWCWVQKLPVDTLTAVLTAPLESVDKQTPSDRYLYWYRMFIIPVVLSRHFHLILLCYCKIQPVSFSSLFSVIIACCCRFSWGKGEWSSKMIYTFLKEKKNQRMYFLLC